MAKLSEEDEESESVQCYIYEPQNFGVVSTVNLVLCH